VSAGAASSNSAAQTCQVVGAFIGGRSLRTRGGPCRGLLSHFGHDISVADSTQTALEIVKAKQFDVVLSDIGLPDGSGYDVIAQAKRNQRSKVWR